MLLKNITTNQQYEVPKDIYNAMESQTKAKFQVINDVDANDIPVQKIESTLSEEQIEIKKTKKPKNKKENL